MPDPNDRPREGALFVAYDRDADRDERFTTDGEPGDGKAEDAQEVLEDLLDLMDLDCDANIREDGEAIELDVVGPDAGRAIGKKGQTLDALQFITNKIVNRFPEARRHVIVDSGDYRERHDKALHSLAEREAQRAIDGGKVVTLKPMSARDRRVIHLSLAKLDGVTTESSGEGMQRRVQIIPAGASPRRGGGGGRRRRRR